LKKNIKVYGIRALQSNHSIPFYEELSKRSGTVSIHFNSFKLIVDMFLAICYREANPQQLEEFKEEVQKEGKMTEELTEIFDTLSKPNPEKKKETEKKLPSYEEWYDLSNDSNRLPTYFWEENRKKWVDNAHRNQQSTTTTKPPVTKVESGESTSEEKPKKEEPKKETKPKVEKKTSSRKKSITKKKRKSKK